MPDAQASVLTLDRYPLDRTITQHAAWWVDPHTDDAISERILTHQNEFRRWRQSVIRLSPQRQRFWLRVQIKNVTQYPYAVFVSLDQPLLENVEFYRLENKRLIPIPRYESNTPTLSLTVPSGSSDTVFMQLRHPFSTSLSLHARDAITHVRHERRNVILQGIRTGTLLLMCLGALIVGIIRRDGLTSGVALIAASMALLSALLTGLIPIQSPILPNLATLALGCMAGHFVLNYLWVSRFLELPLHHPRLARLIRLSAGSLVIIALIVLMYAPTVAQGLLFASLAVLIPLTLMAAHLRWQSGYAPAVWILVSQVLLVTALMSWPLGILSGIHRIENLSHFVHGVLTLQVLVLIPAMFARYVLQLREGATSQQRIAMAEVETRAKAAFLTRLSHDVRTPMNGILGMTELLEETSLTPIQLDYVRTISSSGRSLLTVIDDFMDYTQIEAGDMALDISVFDIASMVAECIDLFRSQADEKSLELVSLINANVPTHVKGDPHRIRQVLANLISNAIKFTEKGDVLVSVHAVEDAPTSRIRFEVKDTGTGLPRERLRELLDGQLPPDQGLGLAIVRRLVDMMRGQLGAQSEPGHGSTFWLVLPLEIFADNDIHAPFFAEQLQGLRMLVVDDNASCRLVMQQQASGWGMHVTTAINGKQAMALMRSQATLGEPFDIIIVDHDMPGMSGLELAAKLKEDPLINAELLVMMLTGQAIAPTATAARNAGIRRVLTKPVAGRTLKIALTEELGHIRTRKNNVQVNAEDQGTLSHLHVLVAEDHPLSQKVISGMLLKLEIDFHLVTNGRDALNEAKSGRYDLVLMDCDMPEMDGFEATRRIRQWEMMQRRSPTPIIALTAHIMDEHKERSLASGMNAHLSKPVELAELRDTLLRWARSSAVRFRQ